MKRNKVLDWHCGWIETYLKIFSLRIAARADIILTTHKNIVNRIEGDT